MVYNMFIASVIIFFFPSCLKWRAMARAVSLFIVSTVDLADSVQIPSVDAKTESE